MYSIEEISAMIQRVSALAIEAEKERNKRVYNSEVAMLFGKDYVEVLPDYYEGYDEAVEDYEAIRVHSEKNCFPARLFANRAPNQTEQAAHWIKDNYKNVTQPVFVDFLNTVLRATHDQNWNIHFSPDAPEFEQTGLTLQKYLEANIDDYTSIESFFKQVMFTLQLKDAMGVIAVRPKSLPVTEDEEGNYVLDSNKLIEPQPYYFTSKQVVGFETGYCIVETNEHSIVEYYGSKKEKGRIYEFYDDQNIWICKQVGKYVDNQFEIVLYYNHGWGKVPATRLRGIPVIYEGKVLYQSPFLFATDLLDLVAQNSAYKQASIAKCVFPATIMLGDICEFEENGNRCNDGVIGYNDEDGFYHSYSCPNCHGVGLVSRLGPLETMLIKPEVRGQNESELRSSQEPLKYVSPEVHTLQFLEESIDKTEMKARKILHLQTSNSDIKGYENMTATGTVLDNKSAFAFIMPIAHTAFENFEFIINAIGWMRYKDKFVKPSIAYPQSFDIGTERDILMTISEMVKNQVPAVLIHAEIFRYLKSVFYTDAKTTAVYELMINTDRLLVLSGEEVLLREAKGLAEKWEVILHDSFMSFVDQMIALEPDFLMQDFEVQKTKITDMAKAKATQITDSNKVAVQGIDSMIQ
jgi:hypothetical protein